MIFCLLCSILCRADYNLSTDQKLLVVSGYNEVIIRDDVIEECSINDLEILEVIQGITKIDTGAFKNAKKLKQVNLPIKSLKSLGSECFSGCSSLKSIVLPEGLETLSSSTFESCGLTEVTFPSTFVSLNVYTTFLYISTIKKFKMPITGLYSVSSDERILIYNKTTAYLAVYSADELVVPDEITVIGKSFAQLHPIKSIKFSSAGNLKEILDNSFTNFDGTIFNLPDGLEKCYSLSEKATYVRLPKSLIEVGNIFTDSMTIDIVDGCKAVYRDPRGLLFNGNKTQLFLIPSIVHEFVVPKELLKVEQSIIQKAKSLTNISAEFEHPTYYSYKNGLYLKSTKSLYAIAANNTRIDIAANCTSIYKFTFSQSIIQTVFFEGANITSVDYAAFNVATKLVSINLPDSVTSVSEYCFSGCNELKNFTFPSKLKTIPRTFLTFSQLTKINLSHCTQLISIAYNGIHSNKKMKTLILPKSLASLGPTALRNCVELESIIIPALVETISDECFSGCTLLNTIIFEEGSKLEELNFGLFRGTSITSIKIPDNVRSIQQGVFDQCSSLINVTFSEESKLEEIHKMAFNGCNSIAKLELPKNLSNLAPQALAGMMGLQRIEIDENCKKYSSEDGIVYSGDSISGKTLIVFPGGLRECVVVGNVIGIADAAFYGCSKLINLTLDETLPLKEIGANTFFGCSGLVRLRIPSKTSRLGSKCFSDCLKLEEVQFASGSLLSSLGESAFSGCKELQIVEFGSGSQLERIEANIFSNCSKLKKFNFPSKLRSIGEMAFANCKKLESALFPSTLESLGSNCFMNCESLSLVLYCGVNPISGIAFTGSKAIFAYVSISYPDSVNTFGGLSVIRVLDSSCKIPSNAFTKSTSGCGFDTLACLVIFTEANCEPFAHSRGR